MTMTTSRGRAPSIAADKPDDWREQSACRDEDADLFYPLGGHGEQSRTGANLLQEEQAKRVCWRCPVRQSCLTEALDRGDDWGVWGGFNERERRALKRMAA